MPVEEDPWGDDPSDLVQQSQERIYQLRRDREAQLGDAVTKGEDAIQELVRRVRAAKERQEREMAEAQARQVKGILSSVERRKVIDAEIVRMLREVHGVMGRMEELVEEGYKGREKDAAKHLLDEKLVKKEAKKERG